MRNLLKKFGTFALMAIACAVVLGANVYASDVFDTDASGNYFGAGQTVDFTSLGIKSVDNELFMAGMDVKASDVDIDGSAFMAGNNVSLSNANVGGSIFIAGNSVSLDVKARNNIWAAGNNISITSNSSVKGVNVAGSTVYLAGNYEAVNLCGNTVTFDAVVDGDVYIEADTVIIGDNAKVGGNLKVVSKAEPENIEGVAEGSYSFEVLKEDTDDAATDIEKNEAGDIIKIGKKAGKAATGLLILKKIKNVVKHLFSYALMALILAIVIRKGLEDAYVSATKKAGLHWGIGAATVLFFPMVAIILCITVIGLPLAGLTTTIYILALCLARVFTFASLVRELIFRKAGKRLNPILECVLAVLPAAVIKEIPVIGGLVGFACAIYTLGYVVLVIAGMISGNMKSKEAVAVCEEAIDQTEEVQ